MNSTSVQAASAANTITPLPTPDQMASLTPGTIAWIKKQVSKFIFKRYTYKGVGNFEYPFTAIEFSSFGFLVQQSWLSLLGTHTDCYPLETERGWDTFYVVFDSQGNKSARQSLINLFGRDFLTMYVRTKNCRTTEILVGCWGSGKFYGVTTKL